jgi:hypothetical protein
MTSKVSQMKRRLSEGDAQNPQVAAGKLVVHPLLSLTKDYFLPILLHDLLDRPLPFQQNEKMHLMSLGNLCNYLGKLAEWMFLNQKMGMVIVFIDATKDRIGLVSDRSPMYS